MRILAPLLLLTVLALGATLPAAEWQMRIADDAAVTIERNQAPVVTSQYIFWGESWQWAGAQIRPGETRSGATQLAGKVAKLGLEIDGQVVRTRPNQLRYTWSITAARPLKNIIGGALEFRLALDSPALGGEAGEPELLADQRGWRWPVQGKQEIRVESPQPLASVYFERGQKQTIRVFLVAGDVAEGTRTVTLSVTLPEGGEVARTLAERYGPADTTNWYRGALVHDRSPVDLSFLNHKPAGKHGFVRADGDRLVFADGTEARFWGGNLAAYALYVPKEQIEAQARRISQLGYNLMRIHHHDSTAWVGRTVIDKNRPDSQHFDKEVMDRLDYWIQCLRNEGVYVWLDLHVGRLFKETDRIGEGWPEMAARVKKGEGAEGKGYCYFNPRIEELMKQFNEEYLNHVNAYTGLAYKDDPAIMGLLVTNENDLTSHFGNLMLPDKGNPRHNQVFETAVRAFAGRHGLPYDLTWKTWVPGPSKLFLADREYQWNRRMLDHLAGIGVRVPVSTTQMWGGMPLFGLPPLVAGGIIDVHSYGDAEALSVNPRFNDNYVSYVASGQALGKPLSITEWNVPYPAADRFTAPLYVASISALQGWDAPMIYNYSQESMDQPRRPSTWSTYSDPALTGMMPAAALLYRQGHVGPAENAYCLMLDRDGLYYRDSHPKNLPALRTLVEQSRVSIGLPDVKELDWDRAAAPGPGAKAISDLDRDFIAAGENQVRSDTGELTRDWVQGVQTIDSPRTQAAHGWMEGREVKLRDVTLRIDTPKAAVAVSSLDGQPIRQSRRLLISMVARVMASEGGKMPMLSEPVRGELTIRAPEKLRWIPLAGDGSRLEAVDAPYSTGQYTLRLPAPRGTHWFLLE